MPLFFEVPKLIPIIILLVLLSNLSSNDFQCMT
jgi:hypothetical protein